LAKKNLNVSKETCICEKRRESATQDLYMCQGKRGEKVHFLLESCRTCKWVISHVCMSHITRMHESCRTHERVISHPWKSHATHLNESYEWVISHRNKSRHTKKWCDMMSGFFFVFLLYAALSYRPLCMSHVNESRRTSQRVVSHFLPFFWHLWRIQPWAIVCYAWVTLMSHVALVNESWLIFWLFFLELKLCSTLIHRSRRIYHVDESRCTCTWVMTHFSDIFLAPQSGSARSHRPHLGHFGVAQ